MKVKAISHNLDECTRERSQDIFKLQSNPDPALHPFQRAREYTRALNAAKLERLFSKPFVGALSGHIDGVYTMAKHPNRLDLLLSGSADGEIRLWDLVNRKSTWDVKAHDAFVKGVCFVPKSEMFLSCSVDKTIKLWDSLSNQPLNVLHSKEAISGIDHSFHKSTFATSSSVVQIWDHNRSDPIQTFTWGSDTVTTVKFNQTEISLFASCAYDRSVVLYDLRQPLPLSKVILKTRSNALCWNPMEAFYFSLANEDHNVYTFDMRRMDKAANILKDHVGAVIDLDYSPTGQEILTGSYDKTLRIFSSRQGHSKEVYHTKRMQRIFSVKFSMDARFAICGSDDGNIRLWKANASQSLSVKNPREQMKLDYCDSLKNKFKELPEVKRVLKHRFVPKMISSIEKKKKVMISARAKKSMNEAKYSKVDNATKEREKLLVKIEK